MVDEWYKYLMPPLIHEAYGREVGRAVAGTEMSMRMGYTMNLPCTRSKNWRVDRRVGCREVTSRFVWTPPFVSLHFRTPFHSLPLPGRRKCYQTVTISNLSLWPSSSAATARQSHVR